MDSENTLEPLATENGDRIDQNGEPFPVINVWVNSGFGNGSYSCAIQSNGMMTLPEGLVRELGLEIGDDLIWEFDDEDGVIYIRVSHKDWNIPEWLDVNEGIK